MSIIYHVEPDDSGLAQHCLDQRQELRRVGGVRRRILILSLFYRVAGSVLRLLKVLRWLNCKKWSFNGHCFIQKRQLFNVSLKRGSKHSTTACVSFRLSSQNGFCTAHPHRICLQDFAGQEDQRIRIKRMFECAHLQGKSEQIQISAKERQTWCRWQFLTFNELSWKGVEGLSLSLSLSLSLWSYRVTPMRTMKRKPAEASRSKLTKCMKHAALLNNASGIIWPMPRSELLRLYLSAGLIEDDT